MTWIKLDDRAPRHPKLASLTDRAFRWWILGLCYASEFLTNGVLHPVFWKRTPTAARKELSSGKLWDWDDPNFVIHDYLEHQTSRESVEKERERNRNRRRGDRRETDGRTAGTPAGTTGEKPPPENREQRTDTENRAQTTATPSAPRALISGESNPRSWGKIHGDHVPGFCDWVCLPDFIFDEFRRKSASAEYVREWAAAVRTKYQGQTVGDNLKFWRLRWSESHPEKLAPTGTDAALTARLQAIERGEIKR